MNSKASIKLINQASSEGWMRQLAFFHLLKYKFNNSCLYNYRSRMSEIAGMLNVSERTLYTYLNFLRSKKLVFTHANNLMLVSILKYTTRKKTTIKIDDTNTVFDIETLLYAKVIEQHGRRIGFLRLIKKFERGEQFKSKLTGTPFKPSISMRCIAKLLKISECKASKVIKNLNRLQVIKTTNQKPQLISYNFTRLEYVKDYPGYLFNSGKYLYRQFGQIIDFLHFPIYLKSISIKEYKKYKSLLCFKRCYENCKPLIINNI